MILRLFLRRLTTIPARQLHTNRDVRAELNTYLEIIPPIETYRVVETKNKITQTLIDSLKKQTTISTQLEQEVERHLLKNYRFFTIPQIKDVCSIAASTESSIVKKLYRKMMSRLERHIEVLSLQDLIDIVYKLAKLNRKEPALMKAVEDRIIEQPIKINYRFIKRTLFSYTHLNIGTTTLYSAIARTIKLGQHELDPLELAEFANYFSRVQDNVQGGFGVYRIAEARLELVLPTMSFQKLIDASQFMLTQNLGSNSLQVQLEEFLYRKFPVVGKEFNINQLVRLLKSTSGYHFKFNENCLLQTMENGCMKMLAYATVEQLQQILWSWARSSRGSRQLWDKLQFQVNQKVELLNARGICFAYYCFSRAPFHMSQIMDVLQTKYSQLQNNKLHYDLKMLQGMAKRHPPNPQLFLNFCQKIISKIDKLSNNDFVSLLAVLNDSDVDYQHKEASQITKILQSKESMLLEMLPYYKLSQLVDILFLWVKMDIQGGPFLAKILEGLSNIQNIPKKSFLKALFSFVMKDRYDYVIEMLRVIYLLREFGPIGYFFPPSQYPLLAYSVFHVIVNGRTEAGGRLFVEGWLTEQLKEYMGKLETGILSDFELKVYHEAQTLMSTWNIQTSTK